jgi:DHA1 family multidrug resistance protein-like MFS transporter
MGTVAGALCGPLLGGVLADTFGFTFTFVITSVTIALATLLVVVGIKEIRDTSLEKENRKEYSRKEVLLIIFKQPVLMTIMVLSLLIQMANFSVQPILALYVSHLSDSTNLAFLAGLAFSATGFGNFIATRQWGNLGDRIGHEKVLLILLFLASLTFVPQALATSLWQLVLFRFLFGIAMGGLIPCIAGYIRQVTPLSIQGEMLGYNQSFSFLGNVAGPVMGGILSGYFGMSSVFFVTSGLFLVSAGILYTSLHHVTKTNKGYVEM